MSFFTPSTMGELLQELKTADRIKALDADIEQCEADQRRATNRDFQKAMRDVNAVKAALRYTPATTPKSTSRIIRQGDPGFAAAERQWKAQRAARLVHKMLVP